MEAGEGELQFGPFTLSLDRRELRLGTRPVPLGTRALSLLVLLAGRAGQVVGKDELVECLWQGAAVDPDRLRAHVATLRRVLGEGGDGGRYIVNVLGRGYVFVAPVRRVLAGLDRPAGALPAGPDLLLGRDGALAALERLVRTRRLVSVVGAGGLGKSAVALAVARRAAPHFCDGVIYLDLAPLADGPALAAALATALGRDADASWPALCAELGRRHALLMLDNCEHLTDDAALLAESLLESAPRLHLVVTSRETLCVHAEWVHRLAPLGLPRPALDLFAQRLGGAGATLDPASQARAAQLCHQLDGNPLLIGLAASRVGSVGAEAPGRCVDALFDSGAAAQAGRHSSPGALFDWSYRLLAPNERAVLRRLSVFCQPFTLAQAGAACSCPRIGEAAVVEAILALGARSLIEVVPGDGQGAMRYRLSNATRRYAGRRLAQEEAAALAPAVARRLPAQEQAQAQ